jgi:hypothetical protein
MSKAELKAAIDAGGGVKEHRTPAWDEAFKQYNIANPRNTLRRGSCGSCYRKVYEWMSR